MGTLREKCPYWSFSGPYFPHSDWIRRDTHTKYVPEPRSGTGRLFLLELITTFWDLTFLVFLLFPISIFPLWFTCLNNWVLHFHIGFQLVSIVEFITLGNQSFSFISIYWFSIRFVFFYVANRWKRCIELISCRDHGHIYRPFRYYPIGPRRCIRAVP